MVYLRKNGIIAAAALALAVREIVVVPVLELSTIFKKNIHKWYHIAPKLLHKAGGFLHPRPLAGRLELLLSDVGGGVAS